MFGQQQQSAFGQGTSLFGQGQAQPQDKVGQSLFGQQQPSQGAGIFGPGGNQSSMGGAQGFGASMSSLGGQQSSFGASSGGGIFGGQQQNQGQGAFGQSSSGLFGGASQGMSASTSGFGNQGQGSIFGGQSNNQASTFGTGMQSQGFGGQQTQGSALFGNQQNQNSAFGQPSQSQGGLFGNQGQQQQSQGSLFGGAQQQTIGGGFGGGMQNQQNQGFQAAGGMNMNSNQGGGGLYSEQQFYPAQLTTTGFTYQPKGVQEDTEKAATTWTFNNLRIEDQFSRASVQMLRLSDTLAARNQSHQNFEHVAAQNYAYNYMQYALKDLAAQKVASKTSKVYGTGNLTQSTLPFASQGGGLGATSNFMQPNQSQGFMGQQSQGGIFGQSQSAFGGGGNSTSIFGQSQNQPQQQNSLFGGNQQQQSNQVNSVFGQQNNSGNTGWGQPQQQNQPSAFSTGGTGSLFGGNQNTQQNQQSSLFGNNSAFQAPSQQAKPDQGSSLFGGANSSSGLFSQPQQQQQTMSMFGQQQQQAQNNNLFGGGNSSLFQGGGQTDNKSLFGGNNNQTPTFNQGGSGSLFGNQPQQNQQNLFGGQPQQNSLFQSKPADQNAGGSLFSNPQQNQGSSLFSQPQGGSSLFNNNNNVGGQSNLFNNNNTGSSLFTNQSSLFNNQAAPMPNQQQQQQVQPQQIQQLYQSMDPLQFEASLLSKDYPLEKQSIDFEKLKPKFEQATTPVTEASLLSEDRTVYNLNLQIQLMHQQNAEQYDYEAQRQREKREHLYRYQQQNNQNQIQNDSKKQPLESLYSSFNKSLLNKSVDSPSVPSIVSNTEVYQITAVFKPSVGVTRQWKFEVHKSRACQYCISKIEEIFRADFVLESADQKLRIQYEKEEGKRFELDKDKKLEEVFNNFEVTLFVDVQSEQEEKNQLVFENQVAPSELQPKRPKEGYTLKPYSFSQLLTLTTKQLSEIEDLTIQNEYGRIQFIGKTDVTKVDFADVVTINKASVEVYHEDRHKATKPQVGEKLNKNAQITLFNICQPGMSQTRLEKVLKKSLEGRDAAEHLYYNSSEWSFKVKHFCKYGVDLDAIDTESDQEMKEAEPKEKMDLSQDKSLQFAPSALDKNDESQIDQQSVSSVYNPLFRTEANQKRLNFVQSPISEDLQEQVQAMKLKLPPIQDEELKHKLSKLSIKQVKEQNPLTKLQQKIIHHENEFNKVGKDVDNKLPSDTETKEWLKKMGVKNIQKTSVGKYVPRVAFHPSGAFLRLSKSKKEVQLKSCANFPLVEVLMAQLKPFKNMPLPQLTYTQEDDKYAPLESKHELFEDSFMRSLFTQTLDYLKPTADQFLLTPEKLNDFLEQIARSISKIWCPELESQFLVICMLNALYGDPTRQLNRLHPLQNGSNYVFQSVAVGAQEQSINTMKRRRNAVVEVLKTMLQSQQPNILDNKASADKVFDQAQFWIEIGNVTNAVKLLKQFRFTREAMILSQVVTPNNVVKELINTSQFQTSPHAAKLFEYICGKQKANGNLYKQVLQELLYVQDAKQDLAQILKELKIHENECLVLRLLSVYSQNQQSIEAIKEMKGNITPKYDGQDFTLKWIVQLVLSQAMLQQSIDCQPCTKANHYEWHLPTDVVTQTAASLVSQLLKSDQTMQAALTAATIKDSQIRTRLVFEVLQKSQSNLNEIFQILNLPSQLKSAVLALEKQASQPQGAWQLWLDAGNPKVAQSLYAKHNLPQLLQRKPLNNLKQIWQTDQTFYSQDERQAEHEIQKIKNSYKINDWELSPCGLFLRTINAYKSNRKGSVDSAVLIDECIKIHQAAVESTHVGDYIRLAVAELLIALRQRQKVTEPIEIKLNGSIGARAREQDLSQTLFQ